MANKIRDIDFLIKNNPEDKFKRIIINESCLDIEPLQTINLLSDALLINGIIEIDKTKKTDRIDEASSFRYDWASVSRVGELLGYEGLHSCDSTQGPRCIKKATDIGFRFEYVKENDFNELSELFARAFGTSLTQELFEWKYGNEKGHGLVARDNSGKLVGHYGFIKRVARIKGESKIAYQVCDVMTDPSAGASLKKHQLFGILATLFQILIINDSKYSSIIGYGFPNQRAMRLAEKLCLYQKVDTIYEATWSKRKKNWLTAWPCRAEPLKAHPDWPFKIKTLLQKMHEELKDKTMVERSQEYLINRYMEHPCNIYHGYLVFSIFGIRPVGLFWLKSDSSSLKLVEIICCQKYHNAVIQAARHIAKWKLYSSLQMTAWCASSQANLYRSSGAEVEETDIFIPINSAVRTISPEAINESWWLSMGDTDFI